MVAHHILLIGVLSVINAECRYAQCRYAECRGTGGRARGKCSGLKCLL